MNIYNIDKKALRKAMDDLNIKHESINSNDFGNITKKNFKDANLVNSKGKAKQFRTSYKKGFWYK